ncbi:BA14K family protein [Acuticoccus sp. M5D2P5]|uniref:BA14K family protein n=1 Tax=Acuticoccus kalidii TaxID=2910977 RepID=UPI001F310DC7|nr:BA14K family protein [Acuticoccus kalidii]MCF3932105.1 BA14K family protein [Acuticoccus kalidii]
MVLGRCVVVACLALAVMCVATAFVAPSPAVAADLYAVQRGHDSRGQPRYYGLSEPWATSSERPPRRGEWFVTAPISPRVNFLVPMGKAYLYAKPEPWTPAWFSYCTSKWPSFNPNTGTVQTPDGVRMCF